MRHTFECIDAHTGGNPVRVLKKGGPQLNGRTMADKRLHFLRDFDWIRKGLMFEPRGHDMMSGSIVYPPEGKANDLGILFIETSGCLPMCGHGMIGTITVILEEKMVIPKINGQLKVETPAGLIHVSYTTNNGKISTVKLRNIPSFLLHEKIEVKCSLGQLNVSIAYGGNFYAIVERQKNYSDLSDYPVTKLIELSRDIRKNINKKHVIQHPTDRNINGLSHVLWTGKPKKEGSSSRNAVFYGENAIDRSPCGTGTSARLAQLVAKGELKLHDTFVHESIIGSTFTGFVEELTNIGGFDAIIPSIEGSAQITGYNTIFIDKKNDPFPEGFQLI